MLDALQHFLWVVELGTLKAAASRAHLSQAAMSYSLQRLEEEFGARLLDRGPRGARLTPAGEALLPAARAALAAVAEGRRAVLGARGAGRVRLAAGATACAVLLPEVLRAFRQAHPAVRIELREATSELARALVQAGEVDLAVVTGEGREPWLLDRLVVVRHPRLAPEDAPVLAFPRGSWVRTASDTLMPHQAVVMELSSLTAVVGQVRAGLGIALVPEVSVQRELESGELEVVPVRGSPWVRQLYLDYAEPLRPEVQALRTVLLASGRPDGS